MKSDHRRRRIAPLAAGALASLGGLSSALAGPDLLASDIPSSVHWTSAGAVGGKRAYSFGIQFCNRGDASASWVFGTNQHAIVAHNVYRLLDGRFEQIGMSWVSHEFFALQQGGVCATCAPTDGTRLGAGCATSTSGNYTGTQSNVSGRATVNPTTGVFQFPFNEAGGDGVFKRLQIKESDLATPGALYFVEAVVIHPDDAPADGAVAFNNASYRRAFFAPNFAVVAVGPTVREAPGVQAWHDHGLGTDTPDAGVHVAPVDVPDGVSPSGAGRFIVGAKAINLGFGRWRYQYAIENLNCDRGAGSFAVPLLPGIAPTVSDVGFHDVDYHSGDPFDPTDWTGAAGADSVAWASPETFAQNPNSNALRWGTLYNYQFDADGPPVQRLASIGLFKPGAPGDPGSVSVSVVVPGTPCPGDCTLDRAVNFADLNDVLTNFGDSAAPGTLQGDPNSDGLSDFADLNDVLSYFGQSCPN